MPVTLEWNSCIDCGFIVNLLNSYKSFIDRVVGPSSNRIELPPTKVPVANIKQYYIVANNDDQKIEILNNMFLDIEFAQIVIFCERKDVCGKLCKKLTEEGFATGLMYARNSSLSRPRFERHALELVPIRLAEA